jgi:hypothetical protein
MVSSLRAVSASYFHAIKNEFASARNEMLTPSILHPMIGGWQRTHAGSPDDVIHPLMTTRVDTRSDSMT